MRIVICEDDGVLRSVLTSLAEEQGHSVIAETDNALDAIRLSERFNADALVLDMALRLGRGQDVIDKLGAGLKLRPVLVFTAFPDGVQASATVDVVNKTDFAGLQAALARLGRSVDVERRKEVRSGSVPARLAGSAEDPPEDFFASLEVAEPDDSLVAFAVGPQHRRLDSFERNVDGLAAAARKLLRVQDRLLRQPGGIVLLLIGGTPGAPASVTGRLRASLDVAGPLWVASAVLRDGDDKTEVFLRITREIRNAAGGGALVLDA